MNRNLPWLLSLLLAASPVLASEPLPVSLPQGDYADDDMAANYLRAPPGRRSQVRQMVNAAIQKNPKNAVALSHRAYFFLEGGDVARAKRDFDAALAAAESGSKFERNVLWSRGWASYDLGEYASALADWQRAVGLHGGRPTWAAYSFALLYWTTGQRDVALAWYDAAVRSNPKWGDESGFEERVRHWSPQQRARMRELFDAWNHGEVRPAQTG